MRRLFRGPVCFFTLCALFGCAASNGVPFVRHDQSVKTEINSPAPAAQNRTDAPAPASDKNKTADIQLIPGSAQICRLDDSMGCSSQAASPATSMAVTEKPAPVAQIPERSYDFGTMHEDRDFVHTFNIKNAGTCDLVIEKIIPDRGSRVARYDRVIPPGGEGTITLSVNARSCSGGAKKSALVTCNDPQTPNFSLVLTGKYTN